MITQHKRRLLSIIVVLILLLSCYNGYAFIPKGSDIISLSVEKIVEPMGLKISQKRKIYHKKEAPEEIKEIEETEGVNEQEIIESPKDQVMQTEQEAIELSFIEMEEKLWFSYPDNFRSESIAGSHEMICVESKGRYIKIIDEFVESKKKSLTDLYTDILLFRQPDLLTKRLKIFDVDIKLSSLQRYEDKIYFVVGIPPIQDKPSSSLWVEKDTSFPSRYTIYKDGMFVDIFYKDWQRVSRTWYPMEISVFLDGVLFSEAIVENFELETDFEKNLFNVKRLMNIYPESGNYENSSGSQSNESNELEKSINEFKKLYE